MLHHIPLELAEDIIDHLADDHTSLLACALTSPKWLTRCRIHLFGTLRISSLEQLYNLHGVLLSNPAFGHIVQAIVVVYGTVKRRLMHDQWAVRPRTALDSAAVLLLPHLPRLRSWSYESAGPHSQNPLRGSRATLACHQQYLAVCELRLIQVSFACTADLARLLLALPALRSLHLSNVDVAQDSPQVMLSWCILRLRQSFQLTTLWCSKVSTRAVLLLDHAVASSVQNLTITTDDHDTVLQKYLSLAQYSRLRSLRIRASADHTLPALANFLQYTFPLTVQTLCLDYTEVSAYDMFTYLGSDRNASLGIWRRVDILLCRLKEVTHGAFENLVFMWPRASRAIIDRWSSALAIRIPNGARLISLEEFKHPVDDFELSYNTYECDKHKFPLSSLYVSPTGKWIVSHASDSDTIFDTQLGGIVSTLSIEADCTYLTPPNPSPNRRYFVMSAENFRLSPSTFTLFDAHQATDFEKEDWFRSNSREVTATCHPGHQIVTHLCLSATILFIADDGVLRMMDIKTGEETAAVSRRRTHPRRGILPGLREGAFAVSPNARWLADWHVRGTMLIWDLRNKVPKLCVDFALSPSITVQEEVVAAAFSPHGSVLIGVSSRGRIWYWDIATGIPLRRPVHHSTSSEISYSAQCAFSRTGARFAWIHYKEPFHPDAMRRVPSRSNSDTDPHAEPRHLLKVLDLSDPGRKRFHPVVLRGHTGPILAFSFSQDGQYVATASADESVRLWQTSDGRCLRRFTEHRARVTHVVISDNGQLLVSGGEDGLIWVRNMEQILVFEGLLRTEVTHG